MHKLIAVLFAGLSLVGYTSCSNNGYEVNVSYTGQENEGKMLYLMNGPEVIDSARLVNNTLTFKGETDSLLVYQLSEIKNNRNFRLTQLFLDQAARVNVSINKRDIAVDDNGGENSIYNEFTRNMFKSTDEAFKQYKKMQQDKVPAEEQNKFLKDFNNRKKSMWEAAFHQNSDRLAGSAILADYCRTFENYASFNPFFEKARFAHYFPEIMEKAAFFQHLENTSEGKMFVDFSGKDTEGKACKLSDFVGKGKYVLVDFWASWCGPCRGEIPNLKAVNKQFGGEKFIVLGINVWDKEKAFKKALDSEKIDYPQIYASDNDEATNLYGINGIPQIMLFGPDGKIIKRNLRGEAIAKTVKEYLASTK